MANNKPLYEHYNPVGRPKTFKKPIDLWNKAVEYFEWVNENNLIKVEQSRKKGKVELGICDKGVEEVETGLIEMPVMRAMTWQGLELFLNADLKRYKEDKHEKAEEFVPIIRAIGQVMFEQKFSGAAAGLLKENIISRELGMVDKQEIEQSGGMNVTINRNIIKGGSKG